MAALGATWPLTVREGGSFFDGLRPTALLLAFYTLLYFWAAGFLLKRTLNLE